LGTFERALVKTHFARKCVSSGLVAQPLLRIIILVFACDTSLRVRYSAVDELSRLRDLFQNDDILSSL